jgi:hypothetical protein
MNVSYENPTAQKNKLLKTGNYTYTTIAIASK